MLSFLYLCLELQFRYLLVLKIKSVLSVSVKTHVAQKIDSRRMLVASKGFLISSCDPEKTLAGDGNSQCWQNVNDFACLLKNATPMRQNIIKQKVVNKT